MTEIEGPFGFRPVANYEDLMAIAGFAETLGYDMTVRDPGYSLEEVKDRLRREGASAFLKVVRIQEDISPKAPENEVEEFVSSRLADLAPESELIIIDPFFFPRTRKADATTYAAGVARLVSPLLTGSVSLTVVARQGASSAAVENEVRATLTSNTPGLSVRVVESDDFHDRFWIADRTRGLVMGTSLNGIGGKIFLIDRLRDADVRAIVGELSIRGI